jgi:hypothetical protein
MRDTGQDYWNSPDGAGRLAKNSTLGNRGTVEQADRAYGRAYHEAAQRQERAPQTVTRSSEPARGTSRKP